MSSLWLNAGIFAAFLIPFDELKNRPTAESTVVQVAIGAGIHGKDINSGGSVPHVALWDERGKRIGQYEGDENGHYDAGSANEIVVKHKQNGKKKSATSLPLACCHGKRRHLRLYGLRIWQWRELGLDRRLG